MEVLASATMWHQPVVSRAYTASSLLRSDGGICGSASAPFWNPWDAVNGEVNACFANVTYPLICVAVLGAFTPWVLRTAFNNSRSAGSLPSPSRLDVACQSLALCCSLLPLTFLLVSVCFDSFPLLYEEQFSLAFSFCFFLGFFIIQGIASRRGVMRHFCLRVSLFLHLSTQLLKLYSAIRQWQQRGATWQALNPAGVEAAALLIPELALCVAFCFCSSELEPPVDNALHPLNESAISLETKASSWGLLTFSWMFPLISHGYRQQLQASDAYPLMPQDTAEAQTEAVLATWAKEEAPARSLASVSSSTEASETSASLLSPAEREHSSSNSSNSSGSNNRRLFRMLCKTYGHTCAGSALLKLVYDLLQFVGPVVLQQVILFLQKSSDPNPPPLSRGLLFCVLLLISSASQTAVLHQYFHRQIRLGMRIRVAVSSLIYRKALRIQWGGTSLLRSPSPNSGSSSGAGSTAGQYVNLMAVDAQRLQDLMAYVHMLWSAPLQISIALFLLFRLLGLAALGGLAVMALNGPLTGFIGRQATRMQRRLMGIRDERSTAVTELLGGIKAVKMYAWECSFFSRISAIRERELQALGVYWRLMVASRAQWLGAPICVSIATFGCYVLLHGDLDAATAFTAIALFDILRFPMQLLPMTTNNTLEARVALARIQNFLDRQEAIGLPPLSDAEGEEAGGAFVSSSTNRTTAVAPAPGISVTKERGPGEEQRKDILTGKEDNHAVHVEGATFSWASGAPLLRDISFECRKGELIAIVGPTGAGKSGLLLSLLGSTMPTLPPREGPQEASPKPLCPTAYLTGSVAYCSQVPWIQSASLKENVLFGSEMDEARYLQVLEACALLPDISALPGGDETEIGERGINLSGGQKQRVALARAVYRQADVYLLDDCLSAVDVHVAQHVFEKCIRGLLRQKAVLLASHRLTILPQCDRVLFLIKGAQRYFGRLQELRSLPEFNLFAATSEHSAVEKEEENDTEKPAGVQPPYQEQAAVATSAAAADSRTASERKTLGALTEEEAVQGGAVPFSVYAEYLNAAGGVCHLGFSVLLMVTGSILLALSNVWLSAWADKKVQTERRVSLGVYAALGLSHVAISITSYLRVSSGAVKAARHFHSRLLKSILDAPMSFFNSTPMGRLLNRLTKCINGIDEALPSALLSYVTTLLSCLITISVISCVFPSFLLVVVPLLHYYRTIQGFYIPTSRQLQRLEAVSRSPVFSHFQETMEGTETIRAYREEARFTETANKKLNFNTRIYYMSVAANRWLAVRLETVGAAVVVATAFFSILSRGYISGGLGGLAVSYALSVTQQLNWMVRMASDRENNIVSVERVNDYAQGLQPERLEPTIPPLAAAAAAASAPGTAAAAAAERRVLLSWRDRLPDGWPVQGAISVRGLCVRYRPELPLVLSNVTFDVNPGEKIGLVGRTGAGKSSLLVSLLRLVEPSSGCIEVDGVDIQTVALRFLRSRFSIIPQDPVLFAGSLRFNVDAQSEHTDAEIWEALEGAHLAAIVKAKVQRNMRPSGSSTASRGSRDPGNDLGTEDSALQAPMLPAADAAAGAAAPDISLEIPMVPEELNPLDMMVEEGGRNFSLGERQLICLARALLRRSRILLLDEATAVVDPRTDALIQETIRTDFKECTVITIAHRIDTIVTYDRVLVLSEGRVEEFDSPRVLYKKKDSFFRSLCLQAGVQPDSL